MAPSLEDLGAADDRPEVHALLVSLKASLPKLEKLLDECSDHWGYEDPIYRFYHQSFKVYALGHTTKRIVSALQDLAADRPLNEWFTRRGEKARGSCCRICNNRSRRKIVFRSRRSVNRRRSSRGVVP